MIKFRYRDRVSVNETIQNYTDLHNMGASMYRMQQKGIVCECQFHITKKVSGKLWL